MSRTLPLFAAIVLALPAIGGAQTPPEPGKPLAPRMFQNNTGHNGFEEIVQAGDSLMGNTALIAAIAPDATLTTKRAALADRTVKQALVLLHIGLSKPVKPLPTGDQELVLQALSQCRNLGRLLQVEQYVCWADGKTALAVDSLAESLRLGYVVQAQGTIGNLVGIIIDKPALNMTLKHLSQLSVYDCQRLQRLVQDWMKTPDPAIASISMEQAATIDRLGDLPNKQEVAALLGARYDALKRMLQQPPWQRTLPTVTEGKARATEVADTLWKLIEPVYAKIMDRWSEELAQVQMLGVHAAVRAYRWEYGVLPTSLQALKLGSMEVDPFTGKSFAYAVKDADTYDLSSKGPQAVGTTATPNAAR